MRMTIIAAAILIVIAAVAILMLPIPVSRDTGGNEQEVTVEDSVQVEQTTVDEEYVLEDLYTDMLSDELEAMDTEQMDYNEEMQDTMAEDLSQFYYD
ncbi:MAG: hypothetical protein JW700_03205 [Candidatus Aenigmarchaeota archaeon]|nr:hypothetical protein [Candidatus Aenigmarchaeota archaeon]